MGVGVAVLSVVVGAVAGCGGSSGDEDAPDGATSAPAATSSPTDRATPTEPATTPEEPDMRIRLTIGDQRLEATLTDSAASRDLLAQLPVTIDMSDHGGVEKTGPLPAPLSTDGQPDGSDPDPGDVGYYAPGHDLVLYYGDQSYFPGIVVLGRLDGGVAESIAELGGAVTVTVEASDD